MGNVCKKKWKKTMFYCFFLWVGFNVFAAQPTKSQEGNTGLKMVSIETVLDYLKEKNSLNFLYNSDLLKDLTHVKVNFNTESWETVLNQALEPNGYTYQLKDDIVVISRKSEQQIPQDPVVLSVPKVRGHVVDTNGEILVGATLTIFYKDGSKQYMITDHYGNFSIDLNGNETKLQVSFIGFKDKIVPLRSDQVDYKIVVEPEINDLSEVIVTGIFDRPKTSFTGAATIITKKEIQSSGNRNLIRTLANIDPSLEIKEQNNYGSDPNNTNLSIEIRGTSSIPSLDEMQLDVRGQLNTPLFILDGFEVSVERVLDMNQNDVESVVILKDAGATALYGSRGSNGVIVITSSHPPVGELRVTYSSSLNLEIPDLSSYNLLNSEEKINIEKIAGLYSSDDLDEQLTLLNLYNQNFKAVQEGVDTDWLKIPTRVGVGQYHRIGIGGGDNSFRYDLNVSYNNITGAMKGSKRDNMNASLNLQYLFNKIRFTNQLELGFNKATNSPYGSFTQYYNMNPYWRPYDENGDPVTTYPTFGNDIQYNPLYDANLASFSTSDYNSIRNQSSMSINFSPSLKWDTSLGISLLKGGSDYFLSPLASSGIIANLDPLKRGMYSKGTRMEKSYQLSTTLNYGKTIEKHSVFLGVNGQVMQSQSENMSTSVVGFANEKLNDISNGISYAGNTPTFFESTVRSLGLTGIINYNFDNRYFLEATGRVDGASSFGSESRYAPFYSLGTAWDLGQENFIKDNLSFIDRLKFRYSYGVTGSLNFSAYQALTTYKYDVESQYTNISGMTVLALGNPNLKWQNTKQHNIGVDFNALNNRISVVLNYYRKTTDNLITQASLPYSNGFTEYTENLGIVRNTGYDAQISASVLRIPEKQFAWTVTAGVSHNENILVELSDAIKRANEEYEGQNFSDATFYQYREGESVDEVYVLKSPGVDPLTGKVLYQDPETGNVYDQVTEGLRKVAVGSALPKINGRFSTSLRYKGLMLDVNFSYKLGGKKLNNTLLKIENSYVRYNMDRRVLDTRWQKPGDVTAYKDIASEDATLPNQRFVFTERALALSNVNLSYRFPQKVLDILRVEQISLTGSISDVFYISNIKKERGIDYPYSIRPTLNLSVTF